MKSGIMNSPIDMLRFQIILEICRKAFLELSLNKLAFQLTIF